MKSLHGRQVFVQSAGAREGGVLDGFAVEVMREEGIDISAHRPRSFEEMEAYGEDFSAYDMIVSFTPAAHRHAIEYTRHSALGVVYWPTLDPTLAEGSREVRLQAFREVRDGIRARIEKEFGLAPGRGKTDSR